MSGFLVSAILWSSLATYGAAITAEMKAVLDKHNVYRCMHGVPLFTWDDAIAANAQAWADAGNYAHSPNSDRNIRGEQCGENLAWGYPSRTGLSSTIAWYSEIKFTEPYGTADSFSDAVPSGEAIGHYTQVVWKTSTKLGCAKGKATVSGKAGDYWVCQYCSAGNYGGQFKEKVLAPTKDVTSCGGTSADIPTGGTSPTTNAGGSTTGGSAATSGGSTTGGMATCHTAPADKSRGQCETCFHGDQCIEGYYCCPYMKKCVATSSMGCRTPIANCRPMCYDSKCDKAKGCDCDQCDDRSKGDWMAWATQLKSNSGSPEKAECAPASTAAGGVSASSAAGLFTGGCVTVAFSLSGIVAQGLFA